MLSALRTRYGQNAKDGRRNNFADRTNLKDTKRNQETSNSL